MASLATIGFKADVTGLKNAERSLDSLARKGEQSENRINKSVKKTNESFTTLRTSIGLAGTALAALGSAQLSREIIQQADAWKNVSSQIRQVTESEEELVAVRTKLLTLSKDTRSDLTNTVDLYAQLTRSTKDLGTSQAEVMSVTKTLNNLFVAGGKPISEVSGAIRQLSQGFAAGALRGDEFNSVAEGAPKIMDALAAKLKMTRGELREFAATGGITAQIMVDALKDYEQVAQTLADQTTKTFGQAMENATTNLTKFVGEADSLNAAVDGLGAGIESFTENLDAVVDGMIAAGSVVAIALIPSLGAYTLSLYDNIKAQLLANTVAVRTANLYGTVATTAATATAATNGLAMASKFLLGPWGLLIAAVGAGAVAFSASKDSAEDLTGQVKKMNKEVENSIGIYERYINAVSKGQNTDLASMSQERLQEEFDRTSAKISLYEKRLDSLKAKQASFARVSDLETKLELEKKRLDEINKVIPGAVTSYEKMSKAVKELAEKLDPQLKVQRELKENTELLSAAYAAGAISLSQMESMLSKLNAKTQEVDTSFSDMLVALESQRQELKMTADEFEIYSLRMDAMANGVAPELIEKLVEIAEANQKMRNEIKLTESAQEEAKKSVEEWSRVSEMAADRIDKAFADVWMGVFDGFKGVTQSIIDGFKRMLAELAHAAISKPIMLNIAASLGLGGMSGAANASGLAGGALSGGLLGGITGSTFGLAASSSASLLGAGNVGAAFSTVGGAAASGNLMTAAGAALPIAALATAAAFAVDKITGGKLFGTNYKEKDRTLDLSFLGGDVAGSTTIKEQKKRSLFRGTKTRYTTEELETAGLTDIFANVQDAMVNAAQVLDMSEVAETFLGGFTATFKRSIKGMDESEVQALIEEWTTKTTESMIMGVFGDVVDEFRKEGEESGATLNRLVGNLQAFNIVSDTLGLNFNLTGVAAARASTNIVEMIGGLDNLNTLTSSYYSNFFTEQEKLAKLTTDLTTSFATLNVEMPQSRQGFRNLVDGLDLTTETGQELFAALMQLVPGMDTYLKAIEATSEAIDEVSGAVIVTAEAIGSAMDTLRASVDVERDKYASILSAAQEAQQAELARINTQRDVILAQEQAAKDSLSIAADAVRASFNAEKDAIRSKLALEVDAINEASEARLSGLNDEKAAISSQKSGLTAVVNSMSSLADKLRGAAGVGSNNDIGAALSAARRGNFDLASGLSGELPSSSGFSSASEFKAAQAIAKGQLVQIANLASGKASGAMAQLAALEGVEAGIEAQIILERENSALMIEAAQLAADEQILALDEQYNALLGIDTTILSLADATKLYQESQMQLEALNTDKLLLALSNDEIIANQILELAQQSYDDEMTRLDKIIDDAQAQINALFGINESVLSVEDAIQSLNDLMAAFALQAIEPEAMADPLIGDGSKKTASDYDYERDQQEVLETIKEANKAVAKNTATTAKILQRIELGGIDTRTSTIEA